jgi:hypothetical protein
LVLGLAGVFGGLGAGAARAETCRLALALGLDVSGSVDVREYRLQMDGLASALESDEVRSAFFELPEAPVSLAVFEWSGPTTQTVVVDWTLIRSAADLYGLTGRLRAAQRGAAASSTALGSAKAFGAGLLADRAACWRRVLDLSGDGTSNTGPRPQEIRPEGITFNGLVIGEGHADGLGALAGYYRAYVVQGPEAFVESALTFDDFEAAIERKLKREMQVIVLSGR